MKITLTPKKGAFTAFRAYADGQIVINTMGTSGSWEGNAISVEVKAVGVEDSEFECIVTGGIIQHNATHVLDSNGRFDLKLL